MGTVIGVAGPHFVRTMLGFLVGLVVGLTSVGAGAVMTPLLVLLLSIPPMIAVGSSIVFGAVVKAFGTFLHLLQKTFDGATVEYLLWGSVPTVALASVGLIWLRNGNLAHANLWVNRVLGLGLVLVGVCALFRDQGWLERFRYKSSNSRHARLRTIVIGVVVGVIFGTTSIGTGSLLVGLLSISLSLPEARIVGTAIIYGSVISVLAASSHVVIGNVDWSLLSFLLAGGVPGVVLGSLLARRAPQQLLRTCFSIGALMAGWELV